MRTSARATIVTTAMAASLALLPAAGLAADPLADGTYEVVVGESVYVVEVVEGIPSVDDTAAQFDFAFGEGSRVLDEFEITVDGETFLVVIAEDGTVEVVEGGELDTDDELDDEVLVDEDDVDDADADGALVSEVARCAPRGRQAREAGLPNHGFFVSSAAQGEDIEFSMDGETYTAELGSEEGVAEFCALVDELLTDDGDDAEEPESVDTTEEDDAEESEVDDADTGDDDTGSDETKSDDDTEADDDTEPAEEGTDEVADDEDDTEGDTEPAEEGTDEEPDTDDTDATDDTETTEDA